MDFFHDLARILHDELVAAGFDLPTGLTDESLVRGYLGVLYRSIPTKARTVLESSELVCPSELLAGYAEIKRKAGAGESLVPHQSRRLDDVEYDDPLFNDWGIQHLHLGTTLGSHGYVSRTGPLLFARVTDETFFAIQIYSHGAWSKQEMLEILRRNWPSSIEPYLLKGLTAVLPAYTDEQISDLRLAGVQAVTQMNGRILAPMGGGTATSGQSLRVTRSLLNLRGNCHQLEQMTLEFAKTEALEGHAFPGTDFGLTRQNEKAVVIERSSGLQLFSVNWPIKRNLQ